MAFPLDIRTEFALGGVWTDVSADVYLRDAMQITRGKPDLGTIADPSSLSFTINNKGGLYSRRNAESPLYGLLGQNTPVRVSIPSGGDHYLQLEYAAGQSVSAADPASLVVDIDARVEMEADWYSPRRQGVIGKWDAGAESWLMEIWGGALYFWTSSDGEESDGGYNFYGASLPVLPERAAVRITYSAANSAGDRETRFYWATSLEGPWTEFSVVTLAGPRPIFDGGAALRIGITDPTTSSGPGRLPVSGRVLRAEVRSSIDGPVVAAPDFRALPAGITAFTDSEGLAWSLEGTAEIRDREDRFVGEISSWPLEWSTDDVDVWTPVQASGILRRMGQGQKALDSTLRRRIPSGNPVAYWPFEEQAEATRAYSPISGVRPATAAGVEYAQWDSLPSSSPLPRLTKDGSLFAPVPAFASGAWQVEFVYFADGKVPPASGPDAPIIAYNTNGTLRYWDLHMREGRAILRGRAWPKDATPVVEHFIDIGSDVFTEWTRLRFWVRDNGDNTFTYRLDWQDVGGSAGGVSHSSAGTCGSVISVTADWGPLTEGWAFGHLAVFPAADVSVMDGSDNAYIGENAGTRIYRLSDEESLSVTRQPGPLVPELVGYQRPDTLLNLLEAAADADGGILSEDPRRIGLRYRDRSTLYTQDPALTLSYTEPGLGPDIRPVDDDSDVRNDVTVTRDGGSSARAVLETGPLSVQPPPNGIGLYDAAYTVSLANDTQPEQHAYWRLHLGTYDGARYPQVTVMLHKPGAEVLIPAVLALREGDKIRLTDLPKWVSTVPVDLIVNGWSELLEPYRWEVTFNCAPGGPWNLAQADHPEYSRAGTDGTVLDEPVTATDTVLTARVTAGPMWTTDPAFFPLPISVGGEEMQVTAVSAPVDGTFTMTVQRSVNGVVKSHAAGAAVTLAHPSIASL